MAKKEFSGANEFERFAIKVIDRSKINEAYYNPRKISKESRNRLLNYIKDIKRGGLLDPVSWNEKTGNLIGRHQRLSILDQLHGGKPYQITVASCNMDEDDEVRANLFLNNASAQGEWDREKLKDLTVEFPDLDFMDCGFSMDEIDIMGIGSFDMPSMDTDTRFHRTTDGYRDEKRKTREKKKNENENGQGMPSRGDFSFMVIFDTSEEKRAFLGSIGLKEKADRIHGCDLIKSMDR